MFFIRLCGEERDDEAAQVSGLLSQRRPMKSAVVRVEKDQESDQVTVALLGLRSNIVTDQQRALDVIERLADSDPIACDLLRYRIVFFCDDDHDVD